MEIGELSYNGTNDIAFLEKNEPGYANTMDLQGGMHSLTELAEQG